MCCWSIGQLLQKFVAWLCQFFCIFQQVWKCRIVASNVFRLWLYMYHQDLIWNGTANCKNISMRYIFSSQESTEMCVVRIIDYCSIDAGQSWYNNTFCLLPTSEQKLSQFCWNWVQSANCCLSLSKISLENQYFPKGKYLVQFQKMFFLKLLHILLRNTKRCQIAAINDQPYFRANQFSFLIPFAHPAAIFLFIPCFSVW